jgi:hypothetical protein
MDFVSLVALEGVDQHMLRYILSPRWHVRRLVNTCSDAVCNLAGMKCVCSSRADVHFVSSLACEGFAQTN